MNEIEAKIKKVVELIENAEINPDLEVSYHIRLLPYIFTQIFTHKAILC